MGSIFKSSSFAKIIRLGVVALSTVMVVACGGGGGSPGVTPGTTGASKAGIVLELVDAKNVVCQTSCRVTTSGPLVARATVTDATGKPAANTVVTFALAGSATALSPSAGTALTNASGVATIAITVKDLATAQTQSGSADTVSASATIGTQALVASLNFGIGIPSVSLKLVTPSSVSINAYQTTTIQVDVFSDGVPYTAQPVTVNFTSTCASLSIPKAVLAASTTTSNGRAQVVYTDKGCSATDTVIVSTAGALPVSVNVVVAAPVAASIGFVSATPADKAIVIQGAGGTGRTDTAVLTFVVRDILGNFLPNTKVNFSVISTKPVTLNFPQSISSSIDGTVFTTVTSGSEPTSFRVVATLAGGQSSVSDTVVVTNGAPVQAAFSLSVVTFNIEGWSHDNEQTKINILVADQFGNPVADNTPIVFTTDSGAIGSSSIGGCLTANGACSVDFRSQDPRYPVGNTAGKRAGLATINVSTTSGLVSATGQTLTAQTGVFLSGSSAQNVFYNGVKLQPFSTTALTTTSCGAFAIPLELNDVNYNPLPVKTKVESTNVFSLTASEIIPKEVPNIPPHEVTGGGDFLLAGPTSREGSLHIIPITPGAGCVSGGGNTQTGTVDIKITTPLGTPVVYSFSLTYPIATPPVVPPTCVAPQTLQGGICVSPPSLAMNLSSTAVSSGNPLTASATVLDGFGNPVPGVVVTFALSNTTIASMSQATALTGPNGVASIVVSKQGTTLGAVTVAGSATVGGVAVTGSASFSVN